MQRNQQRQCKQCGTVSLSVSISISSSKYIQFAHFISFFLSLPFVSFLRLFRHLILLLCVYFNEFHHQTLLSKLKLLDSVIFAPSVSLLLLISREHCEHTLCQGIFQEKFRIACCIRRKNCRP